jgi:two-component system, NtrC family, sensor kinase
MTSPESDLELIGTVARLLNQGLAPEETLAKVAEALCQGLPARSAAIWLREPNATTVKAIEHPRTPAPRTSRSLAAMPEGPEDGELKISLLHEGERLGQLDVMPLPGYPLNGDGRVLKVVADIVAPFIASLELSEDLAHEVALRSREIEEQRRFITLVVDSLPVGLYVVDRDYRIQIWNRKREMGTQGLRRDEVVGRLVFEVLTRQPAEQLKAEFDEVFATGQPQRMEIEVVVQGEPKHFRITKIPMRHEGDAISHVITIGEDVTESHSVQQHIMQSEKLAAIGQLAAGIMHEINNPLATIAACVTAIGLHLEELPVEIPATVKEYLDIIEKEVHRCTAIVDGLLDFSRPKEKNRRDVDLSLLVEETLFLLKHHQRFKRMRIQRELMANPPMVQASPEQLIQAFMAIMLNAVDAMEDGGLLTVRTLVNPYRGDEMVVEIEDTGVGISRSELSKIFEPFFTTKPPGRGTGLGLSISYGIVEQHRGRIEADSQPGRGSIFRVFLPTTT